MNNYSCCGKLKKGSGRQQKNEKLTTKILEKTVFVFDKIITALFMDMKG